MDKRPLTFKEALKDLFKLVVWALAIYGLYSLIVKIFQ